MTVYGYARVSTTKQSLEEQLAELKNQGVRKANIAEKFTGTTTNRPEFERLLKKVKRNDTIVVTKLDRFARNTKEALEVIEPLMDQDIKTINDLKEQSERYGIMIDQIADNIQDLKQLKLLKNSPSQLDTAQVLLYRASRILSELSTN